MTDLLIKNAKIIDGTGAPSFIGNIAIENDVIKAVTPIEQDSTEAKHTIDAKGDLVTPGFVVVTPCQLFVGTSWSHQAAGTA